jgi:large subunit ribosomal protein L20
MTRVTRGVTTHRRHRRVIKAAKGSRGRQKNTFRAAIQRVEKNGLYAYRDRRAKKRTFRSLWIQRINAGARELGLNYAEFIYALKNAGIDLNRKMLSDIATKEPDSFRSLVEQVRNSVSDK